MAKKGDVTYNKNVECESPEEWPVLDASGTKLCYVIKFFVLLIAAVGFIVWISDGVHNPVEITEEKELRDLRNAEDVLNVYGLSRGEYFEIKDALERYNISPTELQQIEDKLYYLGLEEDVVLEDEILLEEVRELSLDM